MGGGSGGMKGGCWRGCEGDGKWEVGDGIVDKMKVQRWGTGH